MSSYEFPNVYVSLLGACQQYIIDNIDWQSNFNGLVTNPYLTVLTNAPLSDVQLSNLTTLLNNYQDPSVWLIFNHTASYPLHSHYSNDLDNTVSDGYILMQTWIFSILDTQNTDVALDSIKSVIEYNCPNVQNFLNITSGNALNTGLIISDLTRNIDIASQDIDINDIVTIWNGLAQTGSTEGNIQYKSIQYTGLMNKIPTNYDCIWQLKTQQPIDPNFTFRCHGLQYLFYDVIYPTPNPNA